MIVFADPILLFIAIVSGGVAILTALDELDEQKKLMFSIHTFYIISRDLFGGVISPVLMFLVLVKFGDVVLIRLFELKIDDDKMILYPIYLLLSLLFSRSLLKKAMMILEREGKK
jgi:hypothetical protein